MPGDGFQVSVPKAFGIRFQVSSLSIMMTVDCRMKTDDWFRVLGLKTVEGMQSPIPKAFGNEGMASLVTRVSTPSFGQGFKPLHYTGCCCGRGEK